MSTLDGGSRWVAWKLPCPTAVKEGRRACVCVALGLCRARFDVVRTSQQWKVQINGVTQQTVPLASICWSKRRADWLGESWDRGDAIGGSSSNKFRVASAIYEASVGGVWTNESWTAANPCNNVTLDNRYKCDVVSGNSMDLWTVQP